MIVVIQASNYSFWYRLKICWMIIRAKTLFFNSYVSTEYPSVDSIKVKA